MSYGDEVPETKPAPSAAGRVKAALHLLDDADLQVLAALTDRLIERRRESVRSFDRIKTDMDERIR